MRILGVDPGQTGALVLVDTATPSIVAVLDMPMIETGRVKYVDPATLLDWCEQYRIDCIHLEMVETRPGEGAVSGKQSGITFGSLIAALRLVNVPLHLVRSAQWKQRAGLKKGTYAENKKSALALGQQTFGSLECFRRVKDADRAEAALIAIHGRPAASHATTTQEAAV